MSIRTTVTLDDDVLERVKDESRNQGKSFRDTLNNLLRFALLAQKRAPSTRRLEIKSSSMGFPSGLNHDSIEALIEYGEGGMHR